MSRKQFVQKSSLAATAILIAGDFSSDSNNAKIKALAFDAFAIFDPRPIFKTVEDLFPDNAKQLIQAWQYRQFSYQWLRLLGARYKNFWDVTRDALDATFVQHRIKDKEMEKDSIMTKYDSINVWPDVIPALQQIKKDGVTVCFLSNMTAKMLHRGIENAKLNEYFNFVISTDERQTYKPSSSAYQMAVDKLRLKKEEILYVPFAGWDMAGAKWFGYPTFWVNRLHASPEMLDAEPDGQGSDLDDLVEFMRRNNHTS